MGDDVLDCLFVSADRCRGLMFADVIAVITYANLIMLCLITPNQSELCQSSQKTNPDKHFYDLFICINEAFDLFQPLSGREIKLIIA